MSWQATKRIIEWRGLTATEKAVAHVFGYHADHDCRNSFPSMETVAAESGLKDVRWVKRIVRRLEQLGVLTAETEKTGGKSITTRYRVNLPNSGLETTLSELESVAKGGQ